MIWSTFVLTRLTALEVRIQANSRIINGLVIHKCAMFWPDNDTVVQYSLSSLTKYGLLFYAMLVSTSAWKRSVRIIMTLVSLFAVGYYCEIVAASFFHSVLFLWTSWRLIMPRLSISSKIIVSYETRLIKLSLSVSINEHVDYLVM